MSPEVHRLFSPEIRDQCFSRFGVTAARLVSNRHAFIFDAETAAGPCILKVVHPAHRPYDQLEAEIDWMLFLVGKGMGLPRIHASVNSLWVERVHADDSYFSVVSYEKLIGEPIGDSLWNETLFRLPLFLQLREVLIYTVAKKMLDLNNLTPIQARLLSERGNRIRKSQPIVDLEPVLKSL